MMLKRFLIVFLCAVLALLLLSCELPAEDPAEDSPAEENTPVSLEGVAFSDAVFTYDGTEKKIELENLPAGCSVVYENNTATDAGVYDASALVSDASGVLLQTFSATLTVNPAPCPTRITFRDTAVDYTGEPIYVEAKTLEDFLTFTYEGNGVTEPGVYTVTVYCTSNNPNYLPPEPKSMTLTVNFVELPTEGLILERIGTGYTVTGYTGTASEVVIPAAVKRTAVTAVAAEAFAGNTSITSVAIRENVTNIGARAFEGCTALTEVSLGEGLVNIGSFAFRGCTSLKELTLPKGLSTVGKSILAGMSPISLTLPFIGGSASSTKHYIGYLFGAASYLENEIYVPATLKKVTVSPAAPYAIPANAFSKCASLEQVVLADGVCEVCNYAFSECTALTSVWFAETVLSVPAEALATYSPFYGCSADLKLQLAANAKPADFAAYWNYVSLFKTAKTEYGVPLPADS